ncbi:hypothetical protein [uncultured Psychrobacter sp.]|uniref:hypothetical protein n=1 Tax=uncultured Psychrobacter sp. TaxID=259303 RepID=UPI0030DBE84B
MVKTLQELLSERSVESQNRIQQLAKKLILDLPAHAVNGELEPIRNEVDSTNDKKPS